MTIEPKFQNEEAERAMIAALCNAELSGVCALDTVELTADHFFHFAPRTIFVAILAIHAGGGRADFGTIHAQLGEQSERLGGVGAIAGICCADAAPSSATFLATELRRLLELRRAHAAHTWAGAQLADPLGIESADAFCAEWISRISAVQENQSGNILPTVLNSITTDIDRMDAGQSTIGLKTSLEAWNKAFGGILESQFYAIGARPGFGKTSLMEQLIDDALTVDAPTLVFEKDMSPKKLIMRMACRGAGVCFSKFIRGYCDQPERNRVRGNIEAYREAKLLLYNPIGLTAEKMCSIVRREIRRSKIRVVFLDHFQVLDVGEDIRTGLTQASITVRRNVTETGVPHIVLCHLNREGGKGVRPSPNHIKEFDQLFGDVDGLAFLWSEKEREDMQPDELWPMKFYAAKNRDGGVSEDAILFDGKRMTFRNHAKDFQI